MCQISRVSLLPESQQCKSVTGLAVPSCVSLPVETREVAAEGAAPTAVSRRLPCGALYCCFQRGCTTGNAKWTHPKKIAPEWELSRVLIFGGKLTYEGSSGIVNSILSSKSFRSRLEPASCVTVNWPRKLSAGRFPGLGVLITSHLSRIIAFSFSPFSAQFCSRQCDQAGCVWKDKNYFCSVISTKICFCQLA